MPEEEKFKLREEMPRVKPKKKRGCIFKLFILLFLLVIVAALYVVGSFFYLTIVEEDKDVEDKGMIPYAETRLYWARNKAVEGWEWARGLVASEESDAPGTGTATAEKEKPDEPETPKPPKMSEEEKLYKEAYEYESEGHKLFSESGRKNWDQKILKRAKQNFYKAEEMYERLMKLSNKPEYEARARKTSQALHDCNKQSRLEE